MSTFYKCAHQYYLSKIAQVPEVPAVYLVAGTAVHTAIEKINHAHYEKVNQQ
jgi:hypothetical protein